MSRRSCRRVWPKQRAGRSRLSVRRLMWSVDLILISLAAAAMAIIYFGSYFK